MSTRQRLGKALPSLPGAGRAAGGGRGSEGLAAAEIARSGQDARRYANALHGNRIKAPSSSRWTPPRKAKPAKSRASQEVNSSSATIVRTVGERIAGKLSQGPDRVSSIHDRGRHLRRHLHPA